MITVLTLLPGQSSSRSSIGAGDPGRRRQRRRWAAQHRVVRGMVAEGLETFVAVRFEIPIMFTMGLGLFLVGALGFLVGLPLDIACRTLWAETTSSLSRYGTSSMVAFGVLGLVAAFYARRTRTGAPEDAEAPRAPRARGQGPRPALTTAPRAPSCPRGKQRRDLRVVPPTTDRSPYGWRR